jgi:hypothetical protein
VHNEIRSNYSRKAENVSSSRGTLKEPHTDSSYTQTHSLLLPAPPAKGTDAQL